MLIYGYPNSEGILQATLETAGEPPAGYIPIDSHDKIGWRYIDSQLLPPLPPPVLPVTAVTRRQFKQALTRAGLRATVEAIIAAADQDTKDWYNDSLNFERANPLLNAMAVGMGKTPVDIDNLFALADTL
jgi:hypothetical protein